MNCATCGVYVNTLGRRHKCKKSNIRLEDNTDQLKLKLSGAYIDQSKYWWNWHNNHKSS